MKICSKCNEYSCDRCLEYDEETDKYHHPMVYNSLDDLEVRYLVPSLNIPKINILRNHDYNEYMTEVLRNEHELLDDGLFPASYPIYTIHDYYVQELITDFMPLALNVNARKCIMKPFVPSIIPTDSSVTELVRMLSMIEQDVLEKRVSNYDSSVYNDIREYDSQSLGPVVLMNEKKRWRNLELYSIIDAYCTTMKGMTLPILSDPEVIADTLMESLRECHEYYRDQLELVKSLYHEKYPPTPSETIMKEIGSTIKN